MTLPENASIEETARRIREMEEKLKGREEVLYHTSYIGRSAPRFLLAFDPVTPAANFGQIVIQTRNLEARDRLRADLKRIVRESFRRHRAELPPVDVVVLCRPEAARAGRAELHRQLERLWARLAS